jgi:hypothetical protein
VTVLTLAEEQEHLLLHSSSREKIYYLLYIHYALLNEQIGPDTVDTGYGPPYGVEKSIYVCFKSKKYIHT